MGGTEQQQKSKGWLAAGPGTTSPRQGACPQQSLRYQQLPLSLLEKLGESTACKAGGSWPQDHVVLWRKSWMKRC